MIITKSMRAGWRATGLPWLPAVAIAYLGAATAAVDARAQHRDILVQSVGGKLATGVAELDAGGFSLGSRVFTAEFPSIYADNNPGFNAIGAGSPALPSGAAALPGSTDLQWDFLPMKSGSVVSALMYWDGVGEQADDVRFGLPPNSSYTLTLFGKNSESAAADASTVLIEGPTLETTSSSGFMHEHRFFFLDDGDQNDVTLPEDGIYLIAMQLRMAGLEDSDPFFLLWGTPGSTSAALEHAARPWVEQRTDVLTDVTPDADFDEDGDVDGHDLLAWQVAFGSGVEPPGQGADADADGRVGTADLSLWASQWGSPSPSAALQAAVVPEPASWLTATVLVALVSLLQRRAKPVL